MKFFLRLAAGLFLLATLPAFGQFGQYSLAPDAHQQFLAADGTPLAGGLVYTYQAGTNSPLATYQDSFGTPNTSPIILDSGGFANIWLISNTGYKFCVADQNNVQQWCVDNIQNHVISSFEDVIALWSGTCNEGTFLRGDGQCITPVGAGNLFANSPYLQTGRMPIASGDYSGIGNTFTQQLVDGPLVQLPLSDAAIGSGIKFLANNSTATSGMFNLGQQSVAATTYITAALSGTTGGLLYKLDSFNRAVQLTVTDSNVPAFIAMGTWTGTSSAVLALNGIAFCTFDNINVTNDYVIASPTVAGRCHDTGTAPPASPPPGVFVIGTVVASGVYIWPHSNDAGLADPGSNGIVYRTALDATRPAVVGDVTTLFGCGSPTTQFLRGDGGCATPSGSGNVSTTGGTTNHVPLWTSGTSLGDSVIQQVGTDGTNISYTELHDESAHPSGILNLREHTPQGIVSQKLFINDSGVVTGNLMKVSNSGGTGQWVKATTSDTDVMVMPFLLVSSDSGGSAVDSVQISGMAKMIDDGTPCVPGNLVVASTTTAATIHDSGGTTVTGGTFTIGVCVIGSSPDIVLLNPQFN